MATFFKILAYVSSIATVLLGIAGSWFWNFTRTNPKIPSTKMLTKAGKIALPLMVVTACCAITSSIYLEIRSYKSAKMEFERKMRMEGRLTELQTQNEDLRERITQVLKRQGIWEHAQSDRELYNILQNITVKMRGRGGERKRLEEINDEAYPFGSLGIIATFNFKWLTKHRIEKREKELAGIILGLEADVIFLQEIGHQNALNALRRFLPQYDCRWINLSSRERASFTGLAILYRRATVSILSEPEIIQGEFYRIPFVQTIKLGDVLMDVANIHLIWGRRGASSNNMEWLKERDDLITWTKKRKSDVPLIIAGSFQRKAGAKEMLKFQELGYFLPALQLPPDESESTISKNVIRHSQFCLSPDLKNKYLKNSIHYEDLRLLFPNYTIEDWRKFADHNPLVMSLRVKEF
jgi:endonuclease/exonuclease/phosphatase family metal-dependent hydrolase